MAFSLRKNSERGVVGLDIDGRYLAAAQVDSGRVVRGASLELPAGLVRDGEVVDRDGLADALKRFVQQAGLPKSVRLGVANQQIVVRVVELPRIEDPKQRDAAVRFQAAEAIAMPLDEAVLDHHVAGYAEALDGTPRMQIVLVAARRSMIDALLEAAKKAGLKPEGVDLDAFALVRTLAAASVAGADDTARVFCHLGGVSNLAIAVGTTCFFTRPLSAVWEDDDAGSRLADEIRLSIDYYMTQPQAKPVGEVVLSGPGSSDDRARRQPRRAPRPADVGCRAARRARRVGAHRRGPAPLHRGRRARDGEGLVRAVNLIPSEQRRAKPSGNGSGAAYIVVGVLAVFLVMAVAYVLTSNKVNENQTKAAEAKQEADALEAQAAQLGSFTNFAAIKDQRLASVVTTAQSRFDWERLMREVSLIMPEGSWLETTQPRCSAILSAAAEPPARRRPARGQPGRDLRRLHEEAVRGGDADGAHAPDAPRDRRRAEPVGAGDGRRRGEHRELRRACTSST